MRALLGLAILLLAGCTLTEVSTPGGDDVLVVEAVLRPDLPRQTVLLHRTLQGRTVSGEPKATVTIRRQDGVTVQFALSPPELGNCVRSDSEVFDSLALAASCYVSPASASNFVVPGGVYELEIRTAAGEQIRGRTEVPGNFTFLNLPPAVWTPGQTTGACALPRQTLLPLTWSRSIGTWSYVADLTLQRRDVDRPISLLGLAISETDTTIVLPSEFGVFQRGGPEQALLEALQRGFPADADVTLTLAAADRNYVNAVRGGVFNPSGPVRLSSVVGDGVGVFGSLAPLRLDIRVGNGAGGIRAPLPSCLGS